MPPSNDSPLLRALQAGRVTAEVTACDHYRRGAGLAVESEYIIAVRPTVEAEGGPDPSSSNNEETAFEAFGIAKTYSSFRKLASQLKNASEGFCRPGGGKLRSSSSSGRQQVTTAEAGGGGGGGSSSKNDSGDELPADVLKLCKYCQLVYQLVNSQRTRYLGKVNYSYVKVLAKQRRQIINDVLTATTDSFPKNLSNNSSSVRGGNDPHPLSGQVATIIETFLLTDHIEEAVEPEGSFIQNKTPSMKKREEQQEQGGGGSENPLQWLGKQAENLGRQVAQSPLVPKFGGPAAAQSPGGTGTPRSVVVPITHKARRSVIQRSQDEKELAAIGEEAALLVDDDRSATQLLPSWSRPVPTVQSGATRLGLLLDNNPGFFLILAAVVVAFLRKTETTHVTMDGDIALLALFAAYCLGLHTPRPMVGGFDSSPTMKGTFAEDKSGRKLLRRSMLVSPRVASVVAAAESPAAAAASAVQVAEIMMDEESEAETLGSPMAMFPEGAKIGTVNNCWSRPDPSDFIVRGPNYLSDKKKVPSSDYLWPCRGLDLFLTDACPENVGKNDGIFGGSARMRELPTFLINFRLPWGVLLFYYEIPKQYIPFLQACYEGDFDKSTLPSLDDMTPPDRTVCRFLMNDSEHKNKVFKIVPVVIDGPWVVRSVVGGKPALMGQKLPVKYFYEPAGNGKACYFEADLDIAANSAARGILSVSRSYAQVLTINLGFVIQGNHKDELPEQMLVGARLHGIDPLIAPSYPGDGLDLLDVGELGSASGSEAGDVPTMTPPGSPGATEVSA